MCRLCDPRRPKQPCPSRRDFLKAGAVGGAAMATGATLGTSASAQEMAESSIPDGMGEPGRRTLIRGGVILSMDDEIGNFASGDVLIEGDRIVQVAASIDAPDATVIDAAGKIVMPGFIDTHHHQFETALRSQLAHGILVNDGRAANATNYYDTILQQFSMAYRPEDVYINELFAGISQIDAGVTTVMDVSQIHHSPEHSDAAIEGLADAGRRAVFGYFEGHGDRAQYPQDARRIKQQYFASDDQLLTMVMGGEIYLPGYETSWAIGRELGLPIALHVVGTFGMAGTFDALAEAGEFGEDNIFIHMTGMSDMAWQRAAGCRFPCLARCPDRDAHAPWHAADPEGAGPRHDDLSVVGRGMHHDRGSLHPDARTDHPAADVRERGGAVGRGGTIPRSCNALMRFATPRSTGRRG